MKKPTRQQYFYASKWFVWIWFITIPIFFVLVAGYMLGFLENGGIFEFH